jgi:hypothetical protein
MSSGTFSRFRRAQRQRTAPHFATNFEPHLRINRLKQLHNYICDTPVATNAVKIARRWVLVSPFLIDGQLISENSLYPRALFRAVHIPTKCNSQTTAGDFHSGVFNAAQASAEKELERVGEALAGKGLPENSLLESQSAPSSSSSSSDLNKKNEDNDSNGVRAEQEVSSQLSQKPAGGSVTGDAPERDNLNSLPTSNSTVPLGGSGVPEEAKMKRQSHEEERPKIRRQGKGRIRELEELKAELAEKEVELLEKEKELLQQEQTLKVLQEELEIERKIRALVTKQKEEAEEEAALAMGLCVGGSMLP